MKFDDVMTIYNYYKDVENEREVWNRSIVKGIQWNHNKSELSTSGGIQTENKVESITIDFQKSYGNKSYLPPQEYKKLTAEQCKGYWTLDAKSGQDVAVLGISDKEIDRQYRFANLQKDFQYAVTVTSVSDNRNKPFLKHIKAVGK